MAAKCLEINEHWLKTFDAIIRNHNWPFHFLMIPSPKLSLHLRGCSELYRIPMVEYKVDSEGTPCEYKTPFRRNTTWHRVPAATGAPLSRGSPTQGPDRLQCQQILQQHHAAIPRSTSFDRKLQDGTRYAIVRYQSNVNRSLVTRTNATL